MRLASVEHDGRQVLVLDTPTGLKVVTNLEGRADCVDALDVLKAPLSEYELRELRTSPSLAEEDVRWRPPLNRTPKNLFCVGLNYREHVVESGEMRTSSAEPAPAPVWFTKPWTSLAGHGAPLAVADGQDELDFEGEMAAVIGRPCSRVTTAEALDHVAGYTILDDVTDRALQREREQWFLGKAGRGHAPLGPWFVTADEVGDPQRLQLTTVVSGEVRQRASTADMLHSFADLVADLSFVVDLEPGDVIAGGTPAGVGMADGRYLRAGDVVEVTIDGLGTLSTPVVSLS